jgi:hypothetical protein
MAQHDIEFYRKKLRQYGMWNGLRYLRNLGVTFEQAYFIAFDCQPVR